MRCESRPASFLGKRQKFFYKRRKSQKGFIEYFARFYFIC